MQLFEIKITDYAVSSSELLFKLNHKGLSKAF